MSTPIGNMGDMSLRAVEVLKSVDMIVAEDTRHSRRLLDHFGVSTRVSAYHEHNEASATPKLLSALREGRSIALISDAGTPLVSDPGARLTQAAISENLGVIAIPGASAALAALVVSGIAPEPFSFFGFLERKGKSRASTISAIVSSPVTSILYEAPTRVASTLKDLSESGAGARRASVSRELTKKFEETVRGTVDELAARFANTEPRGEFVIVIAGAETSSVSEEALREKTAALRELGLAPRDITERLIAEFGAPRNLAYRLAHE